MSDCIFCRIIRGEIPSKKIYEDDEIFAFHDINPIAPVHFMIVPKVHVASLMDVDASHQKALGHLLLRPMNWRVARGSPRASALSSIRGGSDIKRCIISMFIYWAGPNHSGPC